MAGENMFIQISVAVTAAKGEVWMLLLKSLESLIFLTQYFPSYLLQQAIHVSFITFQNCYNQKIW